MFYSLFISVMINKTWILILLEQSSYIISVSLSLSNYFVFLSLSLSLSHSHTHTHTHTHIYIYIYIMFICTWVFILYYITHQYSDVYMPVSLIKYMWLFLTEFQHVWGYLMLWGYGTVYIMYGYQSFRVVASKLLHSVTWTLLFAFISVNFLIKCINPNILITIITKQQVGSGSLTVV